MGPLRGVGNQEHAAVFQPKLVDGLVVCCGLVGCGYVSGVVGYAPLNRRGSL